MLNVLLIDDRKDFLEYLEMALLKREFHVTTARNAEEGLEKLNEAFDIICVDFNMPGMDGYDFCFTLKHHPELSQYSHIPIIGIGDFPKDKREYLCACLPKGEQFSFSNLFYTINHIHFGADLE